MDSYDFAIQLIASETILDCESFTEQAIKTVLSDELKEQNFIDTLNDFKSFEGLNHKFIVNFTGAWLKYALNDTYNVDTMKTHKLIRNILGKQFQQKEMWGGAAPHLLNDELYKQINWNTTKLDLDTTDDRSTQRKYMIMECKKINSNNATHGIQIILLRPKDFLDVLTSSGCTTDYRKYFIALAEIRRSYQETYLPWVVEYYKRSKLTLEQKIDKQSSEIQQLLGENKNQSSEIQQLIIGNKELLVNSRHIIVQNVNLGTDNTRMSTQISDLHSEVSQLNDKIDAIFEFMLSFARMTIPTWIGSSVIKQQYDTLADKKTSKYALDHLKIMYLVGFYISESDPKKVSKTVGDQTILFTGRGYLKIYACCTNFSDIGARIKLLYDRHTADDNHPMMYMIQPMAITLISCEINSERIILENSSQIFPERSLATWNSKYKSFDLVIDTSRYIKAQKIFSDISMNAITLRFQDYQQRIDKFGQTTEVDVDPKIINYIDDVDTQFFSSTRPFCQSFLNSYSKRVVDADTKDLIEYAYAISSRKCSVRSDLNHNNLTDNTYALRKIENLLVEHTSRDHIQYMTEHSLLTKDDLPALRAIAKYENIDVSALEE